MFGGEKAAVKAKVCQINVAYQKPSSGPGSLRLHGLANDEEEMDPRRLKTELMQLSERVRAALLN